MHGDVLVAVATAGPTGAIRWRGRRRLFAGNAGGSRADHQHLGVRSVSRFLPQFADRGKSDRFAGIDIAARPRIRWSRPAGTRNARRKHLSAGVTAMMIAASRRDAYVPHFQVPRRPCAGSGPVVILLRSYCCSCGHAMGWATFLGAGLVRDAFPPRNGKHRRQGPLLRRAVAQSQPLQSPPGHRTEAQRFGNASSIPASAPARRNPAQRHDGRIQRDRGQLRHSNACSRCSRRRTAICAAPRSAGRRLRRSA